MSLRPRRTETAATLLALVVVLSCHAALAGDWRQFRGPGGRGAATSADDRDGVLPVEWSDGENVAWKTALPGRGLSSPVIVGDRVFLTANSGYRQHGLHVLCFDVTTGTRRWERRFRTTGLTRCHPKMSMATPTAASDGERVVAFFSSNDLICLDLDGKVIWLRGLTHDYPDASNSVGMASSPVIVDGTVIVQVENDSNSFAAGIDLVTGANRWKIARPAHVNWASPVALAGATTSNGGVILQSHQGLSARDARTGRELWTLQTSCAGIPSTTAVNGVLYVPSAGLAAFALDATASPTSHPCGTAPPTLRWQNPRLRLGTASPLLYRGLVYVISGNILRCAAPGTGELRWQLRLEGRFSSTPVAGGGHIYAANENGLVQVIATAHPADSDDKDSKSRLVATNDLADTILCTPAIAGGAFYVRSDAFLWKIARTN